MVPENRLILLVTQNTAHYCTLLHKAGFESTGIRCVVGGAEGLRQAHENPFHCLLLDVALDDMSPAAFLDEWHQRELQQHTAIIFLVSARDEQQIAESLARQGQDYLVTDYLTPERLYRTVTNAIVQGQSARTLAAQEVQIQRLNAQLRLTERQWIDGLKELQNDVHPDSNPGVMNGHGGSRLIDQLQRQAEELNALYNASSVLFKSRNVLELSHQISQAIIEEFKHFDCGILLRGRDGNKLVRAVRAGDLVKRPMRDLYLDGPGLVPAAIRTNRTIYAPHVKEHPLYVENDSSTRSELVIPLRSMNGVLGVFDLQSTEEDAFSERDQRILQMFAERAAAALEVVQLYEEQDQNAAMLEFRVAQRTAEFIQSKDKVEAIFNSISDAIILINASRQIEQVNPAFQSTFGHDASQIEAQMLDQFFDVPETAIMEIVRTALEGASAVRHELPAKRQDGSIFTADTIFSPLVHENYQHKLICTIRDVSLQKQLENELLRALQRETELGEIKTRFTSMVSHEIRTPLAVILSTATVLDLNLEKLERDGIRDRLKKIGVQVGRLTNMMDDVLTLSRAEVQGFTFHPTSVNMKVLCTSIMEELSHAYPHARRIQFTPLGDCERIIADEALLRHIVNNLLSNALKYSPPDRPITFDLSCVDNQIRIKVKDEGIGIPEASQKHLFESFHRANNVGNVVGTGLGMAIAKKAVDAHQGKIWFESKEGQGSTFEVLLPTSYSDSALPDLQLNLSSRLRLG